MLTRRTLRFRLQRWGRVRGRGRGRADGASAEGARERSEATWLVVEVVQRRAGRCGQVHGARLRAGWHCKLDRRLLLAVGLLG